MSREAFEKWWPSVGQTIGKVAAWEAWQAALQSGEAVVDVNQQLVEALKHIMKMQTFGYIVLGEEATTKARKALLSAGKGGE